MQVRIHIVWNATKIAEIADLIWGKQARIEGQDRLRNSMVNPNQAAKPWIGIEELVAVSTATSIMDQEPGLADEVVVVIGE